MIHLKTFEKYNFSDAQFTRMGRDYYFDSEMWSYKVSVSKNDSKPQFPYVGFKAKKIDDVDFNYDMSVITNDSVYQVMDTIKEILNYDYNKHNNEGYKFSFVGDKHKANQRLNLYMRILEDSWEIDYDEQNNQYYLTKRNHIKTFEKYGEEFHDSNVDLNFLRNLTDEQIYKYMDEQEVDYEREEEIFSAIKELKDFFKDKSENDVITLFRVLKADSESDIKRDELGEHYTTSLDNIDSLFLFDIGLSPSMNLYSVEVRAKISDVNLNKTIISNVDYPFEMEITLLDDSNIEIIDIKPFEVSR